MVGSNSDSSAYRASISARFLGQPGEVPTGQRDLHDELFIGQLDVALGLSPLARQAANLRLHLRDEVFHSLEIDGRLLQAALGAVLPVAIEADSSGLLEQ